MLVSGRVDKFLYRFDGLDCYILGVIMILSYLPPVTRTSFKCADGKIGLFHRSWHLAIRRTEGGFSMLKGSVKMRASKRQLSHEKNPPTFHYTGWLIGILIMVYYNPYITG